MLKRLIFTGLLACLLTAPDLASAATYTGADNDAASPGLEVGSNIEFRVSATGLGGNANTAAGGAGIWAKGDLTSRSTLFGQGGRGSDSAWVEGGSGIVVDGDLHSYGVLQGTGGEGGAQGTGGVGIYVGGDYFSYKGGLLSTTTAMGNGNYGLLVEGNASLGQGTHLLVGAPSGIYAPGLYVGGDLSFEKGSRLIMLNENSGITLGGASKVSMENISVYLLDTLIVDKNDPVTLNAFLQGGMIQREDLPGNLDGPVIETNLPDYFSSMVDMKFTVKEDIENLLGGDRKAAVAAIRAQYKVARDNVSAEELAWYIPVLDIMYQSDLAGVTRTADRFINGLGSANTANTYIGMRQASQQARSPRQWATRLTLCAWSATIRSRRS